MEPTSREIIDALEDRYGSSRAAARAIGVHFPVYLMWISDPESMPAQVRKMLAFRAGLRGRRIEAGSCGPLRVAC